MAIFLVGTIAQTKAALCQCGEAANLCKCIDPPSLSIKSNTIFVSGQTVHLSGKLPSEDEHWFYNVTCHTSSRLFNFSLWTISKFHDRDGFYFAKSWNLQIMDSKDDQEKEIIFDRENEFYFWGDAVKTPEGERIKIDSIVGLPEGIHGDVILRKVRQEGAQGHTAHH
ncbi:MAG: hypothetical protein WCA89_08530 [Terracidiphilus sp.]